MFEQFFSFLSKIFLFGGKLGGESAFLRPLDPKREAELFEILKNGTKEQKREAEEELCAHNMRLVAHVAKKFHDSKLSRDELASIGSIGLLKAIRTFSSEKANFSTYASRCISNEILMFFRADKKNSHEVSLEDTVGCDKDGNEICLLDILSDSGDKVEREAFARVEVEKVLHLVKTKLSEREQKIIALRFGLFEHTPHTQKEVAKILGISRSYVSRIETAAIEKIAKK